MRIVFDRAALEDLQQIFDWISQDSPRAAERLVSRIFEKVERLSAPELCHMGRLGLVRGTRELLEGPYIIVYEVQEDKSEIVVTSVVHGARDRSADER
jgi:addiction module RelE/StbE family toxin